MLLPAEELAKLRSRLTEAGLHPRAGDKADRELIELRQMYEPFLFALSRHFDLALPPWVAESGASDNWRTSVSVPKIGEMKGAANANKGERHF